MPDEPNNTEHNEDPKAQQRQPADEQPAEAVEGVVEPLETEQQPSADDAGTDNHDADAESVETVLDPIAELKLALETERARAEESYDLALRTKAEMENLRKRSAADVDKARKFALDKFATEIVAVRDSLEMGLDAASKEDADVASIREGTELTLKMLASAMEKFAVEQIDPAGQPFDPELHQAMGMQESAEHAPNTVMMVMQKGYTLNGRLIRPAMVMVSKA